MRVGIITLSDSAFLGQREDESGAAIEKIMQESKYQVVHRSVLPDSRRKISEALKDCLLYTSKNLSGLHSRK